jgi:hypothetical protein
MLSRARCGAARRGVRQLSEGPPAAGAAAGAAGAKGSKGAAAAAAGGAAAKDAAREAKAAAKERAREEAAAKAAAAKAVAQARPPGWFIGNAKGELFGKQLAISKMTYEEREAYKRDKFRRSHHRVEVAPMRRNSVIVHANGATSIMGYAHPSGWPVVTLNPCITSHAAWASPKEKAALVAKRMQQVDAKSEDLLMKEIYKRKKA